MLLQTRQLQDKKRAKLSSPSSVRITEPAPDPRSVCVPILNLPSQWRQAPQLILTLVQRQLVLGRSVWQILLSVVSERAAQKPRLRSAGVY